MDWDKLRVFHAVAEAGSFTHAGEALSLSQSAVSRQISALEESLRVPLFHRHARGLILTEQGELLQRTAREIFSRLSMTEAILQDSRTTPKGPLTITTTFAFGSVWLTPRMHEFQERYPDIQLTLLMDDHELDLAMREADVAIRMQPPRQPDLIQRHLASIRFHLYATRDYIARAGTPQTQAELKDHRLIVYPANAFAPFPNHNWLADISEVDLTADPKSLKINSMYAIFRATLAGNGIASLPDFLARGNSELVQVLPEVKGPRVDSYFVYAEELRHSKRIEVLRDFLIEKVQAESL